MTWTNNPGLYCGFLAQIFTEDEDELHARGTGILVSPDRVLTWAHEVVGVNIEAWNYGKYAGVRHPIRIVFKTPEKTERSGTLVSCADPDMAPFASGSPRRPSAGAVRFGPACKS